MFPFVRLVVLLIACGALAGATSLGLADGFNVFIIGDFRPTNADVGGRLAVGGTAQWTSFSVAQAPNHAARSETNNFDGTYSLIAGDLDARCCSVFSGNVWDGATPGDVGLTLERKGVLVNGGTSPIDFAAAAASLQDNSTYWGGLAPTGTAVNSGALRMTATNATGLNVFNVTPYDLENNWEIDIDGVTSSNTILINVLGNATITNSGGFRINGMAISGDGTTPLVSRVIFNFYTATTVNMNRSFMGSILAPYATVNGGAGQMTGALIAKNYTGVTEFHDYGFDGALPEPPPEATPEPMSMALVGGGLLALGLLKRR